VPSQGGMNDVAITLGDNWNSELTGLGDSKHAVTDESGEKADADGLPSTVLYSVPATQDVLDALYDIEADFLKPRKGIYKTVASHTYMEDDGATVSMAKVSGLAGRGMGKELVLFSQEEYKMWISRLEACLASDWDRFDDLNDVVDDLKLEVGALVDRLVIIERDGCGKCGPSTPNADKGQHTTARNIAKTNSVSSNIVEIVAIPPVAVVIERNKHRYTMSDDDRVTASYASVVTGRDKSDGFTVVSGRK